MPKVFLTERQKKDDILRQLIAVNMAKKRIHSLPQLAKNAPFCQDALYKKIRGENEFKRSELIWLFEYLGFTDEEKAQCM